MAGSDDRLGVDADGSFVKWDKLIDLEAVITPPNGVVAGSATEGVVPGVTFGTLLKPYIGRKVKINIVVKKEL